MADFTGLSIWDNLKDESGTRKAELRDVVAFTDHWSIEEGWSCSIEVGALENQRAEIIRGRVIQVESANEPLREYRIAKVGDRRSDGGDPDTIMIDGQDPLLDLAEKTILVDVGSGGVVAFDGSVVDLTPQDILDTYAIPAAQASGIAVDTGTIEPDTPLSLDWSVANALSLIRQVISALFDVGIVAELDYRRDPGNGYLVDILDKIGAAATAPELHVGRHVAQWERTLSRADQASVVIPLGGVDGTGAQATIARAAWKVSAINGGTNTLTVIDPMGGPGPVQIAGQATSVVVGSWYVQVPSTGALLEVLSATRVDALTTDVELADVSAFTVGDVFEFRSASGGTLMYLLLDPTAVATLGAKIVPVVQEAGRGERNLIPNPWQRVWPGATAYPVVSPPPAGWNGAAGNVCYEETDPLHTRFGGHAMRIVSLPHFGGGPGTGFTCPLIQIWPVAGAGLFSVTVALEFIVVQNDLSLTIYDSTNARLGYYVIPRASLPAVGVKWDLSIAGIDLSAAVGGVRITLTAENRTDPSPYLGLEFYWDAVQLTQTPSPADEYTEFSRANQLWQYGNAYLAQFADPPPDFEVSLVDLARIDPGSWAHVEVERGATARLIDSDRGLDWNVRVIERTRNRLVAGDTTFTFSTRSKSFAGLVAGIGPGGVPIVPSPPTTAPPPAPPPPPPPPPPAVPSPLIYSMYGGGLVFAAALTSFPSAPTERSAGTRAKLPLANQTLIRLSARVVTPLAGGRIIAVYSLDGTGTPSVDWTPFGQDTDGNLGPLLPLDAAGDIVGVSVPIAAAAQTDVFVAFVEYGGDDATTVEIGNSILTTYGGAPTAPFPVLVGAIADWNPTEQSGQVLGDKVNLYHMQLGSTSGADSHDPAWDGTSPPFIKYGNDDYCKIWDEVDIIFDDSDTLGVFEFPNPLPSGSADRRHLFGIWGMDGGSPDWHLVVYCYESDWLPRFRVKLSDASEVELVGSTPMGAGETHSIGISYDFLVGSVLRLFIDGVEEDTSSALAFHMKDLTPRYFYLGNGSVSDPGVTDMRIGRTVKFSPQSMDASLASSAHAVLKATYPSLP